MKSRRAYWFVLSLCLFGYIWLFFVMQTNRHLDDSGHRVCLIKNATGIPCPSCGSTRAIVHLLRGDWQQALYINPLSYFLLFGLIVLPVLALVDLTTGRALLPGLYFRAEAFLKRPPVFVVFMALIAGNWIWNICKGL